MKGLERLIAHIPPPERPEPYEHELRRGSELLRLPSDYLALLAVYGPGLFLTSFRIYAPGTSDHYFQDMAAITVADGVYPSYGAPPWPEPGCLVSWGDENGDPHCWRTDDPVPDAWPVFWRDHEDGELEQMEGTATDVLVESLFDPEDPPDEWSFEPSTTRDL